MFYPMLAMFLLTFTVLLYGLFIRIKAVKSGEVSPQYFKIFQSDGKIPTKLIQHKNHFDNLFQIPILFYVACTIAIVQRESSAIAIYCAWAFVFFRVGHTIVHLTHNHVLLRLGFFVLSNISLIALWVLIAS